MGLVPLGVICDGGNVHMGWPWPWGGFLPAERSTGTDRGLEGLRLCCKDCAYAGLLAIRMEKDQG